MSSVFILPFGNRKAKNKYLVRAELNKRRMEYDWGDNVTVINGCASGVDSFGREWGQDEGFVIEDFPIRVADWERYGHGAGPRRNHQMLDRLLQCEGRRYAIGFPGGSGTFNMADITDQAIRRGANIRLDLVGWDLEERRMELAKERASKRRR